MPFSIPKEMKALQVSERFDNINDAIQNLKVVTKPLPPLKKGQVLIKIAAAPCNPSDLLFIQGKYAVQAPLPFTPGLEGSGTVVASGGGLYGKFLIGKRVACAGNPGTWSEYYIADAKTCIPLKSSLTDEQGATLFVNPFTAYAMLEIAKKEGHAAIVQTAAASQCGRQLIALAANENIPIINVVRREEQEDLLLSSGAKYVLNSEKPYFADRLKEYSHDLKATIAFDAVAGKLTGIVFDALPPKSKVVVYGTLSMQPCDGFGVRGLIGENKKLEGFMMRDWILQKNPWSIYRISSEIQDFIAKGIIKTSIRKKVKLHEAPAALLEYQKEMTSGKIIISP